MSLLVASVLSSVLVAAPSPVERVAVGFLEKIGVRSAKVMESQAFPERGTVVRCMVGDKRYSVFVGLDGKRVRSVLCRDRGQYVGKADKAKALHLAQTKIMALLPRKDVVLRLTMNGGVAVADYDLKLGDYPVWNNGYSVHFVVSNGAVLRYVDGVEGAIPDIKRPMISAKQALERAQIHARAKAGRDRNALTPAKVTFTNATPSLGYLMEETGAQLVYRFDSVQYPLRTDVKGLKGPGNIPTIYISARSGQPLDPSSRARSAPMMRQG